MPDKKASDTAKSKNDEAAQKRGYFDFRKKDEKEETMV